MLKSVKGSKHSENIFVGMVPGFLEQFNCGFIEVPSCVETSKKLVNKYFFMFVNKQMLSLNNRLYMSRKVPDFVEDY